MNITDYAIEARKTAIYAPRGTDLGMAYAALGLVGEATEFLHTPTLDELGDVLWYVVALADELGAPIERVAADSSLIIVEAHRQDLWFVYVAGRTGEHVKKYLRTGEQMAPERRSAILGGLAWVMAHIIVLAGSIGSDPESVMRANVAKLRARQASGTLAAR